MLGLDKVAHFGMSFAAHTLATAALVAVFGVGLKHAVLLALVPAVALGLIKEYVDYLRYNGASLADMVANLAGLGVSLGAWWAVVASQV